MIFRDYSSSKNWELFVFFMESCGKIRRRLFGKPAKKRDSGRKSVLRLWKTLWRLWKIQVEKLSVPGIIKLHKNEYREKKETT